MTKINVNVENSKDKKIFRMSPVPLGSDEMGK
jgi:hypothetical protein